jgi:hypothetical protein
VVNARRFLDLDDFFLDLSELMVLHFFFQGDLDDLFVIDVVVMLRVVLEDSRVTSHYLEKVVVFLLFIGVCNHFHLFLINLELLGNTNDHGSSILDDVHGIRLQD